jgi:hypothetical protein
MSRARAHPLRYAELRRRLKQFGVIEMAGRGKGSERVFFKPDPDTGKGPQHSVKCHGENTEIRVGSIVKILLRFAIDADLFWAD